MTPRQRQAEAERQLVMAHSHIAFSDEGTAIVTVGSHSLTFGFEPHELRALATQMTAAADRIEGDAAPAVAESDARMARIMNGVRRAD